MDVRTWAWAKFAGQLKAPHGPAGHLVGRRLNRVNGGTIAAAVECLDAPSGAVLGDLGFGGGVGLELLLGRVGTAGRVHGVDISADMVKGAGRRFAGPVHEGRLVLHTGAMEALPLPSGSLDAAITLNTIYFIEDLAAAFSECARVLCPAGQVVVGLGDPVAMARLAVTTSGFILRPVAVVCAALREAELKVEDRRRVGSGEDAYHLLISRR